MDRLTKRTSSGTFLNVETKTGGIVVSRLAAYEDTGFMPGEIDRICEELERYKKWVNDLQSGMYVNCVYCGHRYGPEDQVPTSIAEALKEHIEHCPEHPMSKLRAELEQVKVERDAAIKEIYSFATCSICKHLSECDEIGGRCEGRDFGGCCNDDTIVPRFEWRGLEATHEK